MVVSFLGKGIFLAKLGLTLQTAISSFFEILLLFSKKYSGHVGLFLRLLISSFSIFQVSLTFAFCFSNIEL